LLTQSTWRLPLTMQVKRRLVRGEVDAMLSPFPDARFFPEQLDSNADGTLDTSTAGRFRAIPTHIVAGTPYWAAID
jgi:hypothetical protein